LAPTVGKPTFAEQKCVVHGYRRFQSFLIAPYAVNTATIAPATAAIVWLATVMIWKAAITTHIPSLKVLV